VSRWSGAANKALSPTVDTPDSPDTPKPERPGVSQSVTSVTLAGAADRPSIPLSQTHDTRATPDTRNPRNVPPFPSVTSGTSGNASGERENAQQVSQSVTSVNAAENSDGLGRTASASTYGGAACLEALKAEVISARQVFHAELAIMRPILGDIFREWPDARITSVVDRPAPQEDAIVRSEPPSPKAVEALAHELLERAEHAIGVGITDRVKVLNYFRARAAAGDAESKSTAKPPQPESPSALLKLPKVAEITRIWPGSRFVQFIDE
jgi:hypothetical protein